ncbi:purine permease 21-like [Silene latifolia]|uniref:purine permease 21-like n=1 Tax=Silene latifolia TaxID=37657 RepID=UPI003D76FEBF
MGEEAQEQEVQITDWDKKETSSPQPSTIISPSNTSKLRQFEWRILITLFILFILLGQAAAVLLGRLYYNNGGKSKWMATLVQVVGFPVLLPLYKLVPKKETVDDTPPTPTPTTHTSVFKVASFYIFIGLFVAAMCMLYSIGLQYMPVSTFSLICSSQLGFNALFAFFINSQKFTPYIINSVVLLTISSTLLCFHSDSSLPKGVSKKQYAIGFVCTIVCSAGYGLYFSLTQFAFQKLLKKTNFKATVDMIIYPLFVASVATVVGLLVSGEWKTVKTEMHKYELGKISYVMTLLWTAMSWQVYTIGVVGLINKVSSLFSNVVATLGLPIVPVLAVIFFHDSMDGVKVVAMVLALWGFVSYGYQQYLDHKLVTDNRFPTFDSEA